MQLTFPDWYDDFAEFEHESKGYLEGVALSYNGRQYLLNFYEPTRLQQDVNDQVASQGFWMMSNLVIVPKVTRSVIEAVVKGLSESDLCQTGGRQQ
jgi:hypothetical protein